MILRPHSSHLTQPLDVGVFGLLKKVMVAKIDPLLRTGVANVQKWEWLEAIYQSSPASIQVSKYTRRLSWYGN